VNPPTGGKSGKRNLSISTQLGIWFEANDSLGEAFDSSTGFALPNGANRSPDAAWVRRERWDTLPPEQQEGFVPLCPDFVVQLRSKTDALKTLQAKMQEYIDNGAQSGCLIDPQTRRVEIYRPKRIFGKYPVTLLQTGFWPTEPYALKRLSYRPFSRVSKCPLKGEAQPEE